MSMTRKYLDLRFPEHNREKVLNYLQVRLFNAERFGKSPLNGKHSAPSSHDIDPRVSVEHLKRHFGSGHNGPDALAIAHQLVEEGLAKLEFENLSPMFTALVWPPFLTLKRPTLDIKTLI